jgi:hypothetical protein
VSNAWSSALPLVAMAVTSMPFLKPAASSSDLALAGSKV